MSNVQSIQRTIYGDVFQSCATAGIPYPVFPNSTLNQLLGINQTVIPTPTDVNSLSYICIGIGGGATTPGIGGLPDLTQELPHRAKDAGLYYQIPFVLRALNNDLTMVQVAKYRLRKIITIAGVQYAAYYGLLINKNGMNATVTYNSVSTDGSGTVTPKQFAPTSQDLTPTPPVLNNSGVIITTGDYLQSKILCPITLAQWDINEILNACTVLLGNPNYAVIREIALCFGVDKQLTGTFGGNQVVYTEAVGVTVMSFITGAYPLVSINNGLTITPSLAISEPLIAN